MKSVRFALLAAWLLGCRSETGGTADFTPTGSTGGAAASGGSSGAGVSGSSASQAGASTNVGGAGGSLSNSQGGSAGVNTSGGGASGDTSTIGGASGTGGTAGASANGGTSSGGAAGASGAVGTGGNSGNSGISGAGGGTGVAETAFLMNTLTLRDPHAFISFFICNDVTDTPLASFSVNGQLKSSLSSDTNNDGLLDLAPVLVFAPLDQSSQDTTPVELVFANCTAPVATTSCKAGTRARTTLTGTNQATGTCSNIVAGTTRPYTPAVSASAAPCFGTDSSTITLPFFGTQVPLKDAQISATYSGTPATSLTNGVMRGFLSQADADATIIPMDEPAIGGKPLSALLAGGTNACPSYSDMDTDNGVAGWWFYFNFTATPVTWSEQ